MSSDFATLRLRYGRVRKKSYDAPAATAANSPATRSPVAAAPTTQRTSTSTPVAAVTWSRTPASSEQVRTGRRTAPARAAVRHGAPDITGPPCSNMLPPVAGLPPTVPLAEAEEPDPDGIPTP